MRILKIFTFLSLITYSMIAFSYIGPAAGIPIIGSVLGFFVTVFLVIIAILFWPIRKLLKKRKAKQKDTIE